MWPRQSYEYLAQGLCHCDCFTAQVFLAARRPKGSHETPSILRHVYKICLQSLFKDERISSVSDTTLGSRHFSLWTVLHACAFGVTCGDSYVFSRVSNSGVSFLGFVLSKGNFHLNLAFFEWPLSQNCGDHMDPVSRWQSPLWHDFSAKDDSDYDRV